MHAVEPESDAETWEPLRSMDGDRVVMSASSETVPIEQVEGKLQLSAAGARAARRR